MPMIDMPATPVSGAEVVMELRVGEAGSRSLSPSDDVVHRLGVCRFVGHEYQNIHPELNAGAYVNRFISDRLNIVSNPDGVPRKDLEIRILKEPEHGKLEQRYPKAVNDEKYLYDYLPDKVENNGEGGYYAGYDYFVIEVSADGITVQIHYTMSVGVGEVYDSMRCPQELWKISNVINWSQPTIDQPVGQMSVPFVRKLY